MDAKKTAKDFTIFTALTDSDESETDPVPPEPKKRWLVKIVPKQILAQTAQDVSTAENELKIQLQTPSNDLPKDVIALSSEEDMVTAITGPNNAGKTRLLRTLACEPGLANSIVSGESDSTHVTLGRTCAFSFVSMEGSTPKKIDGKEDIINLKTLLTENPGNDQGLQKPAKTSLEHRLNADQFVLVIAKMLLLGTPNQKLLAKGMFDFFERVFKQKLYCMLASTKDTHSTPNDLLQSDGLLNSDACRFLISRKDKILFNGNEIDRVFVTRATKKSNLFTAVNTVGWQLAAVGMGMRQFLGTMCNCVRSRFDHNDDNKWGRMLLCVDEPELGLHAPQAEALGGVLVEMATLIKGHIVLTSHSAPFLRGMLRTMRTKRVTATLTPGSPTQACQLVRITQTQAGVLTASDTSDAKFAMHVMSNVVEAVSHEMIALVEDDSDGMLFRVGVETYLAWLKEEEKTIEVDLNIDGHSKGNLYAVARNIFWFNVHSKEGAVRFTSPLSKLRVPTFAWFDIDAMDNKPDKKHDAASPSTSTPTVATAPSIPPQTETMTTSSTQNTPISSSMTTGTGTGSSSKKSEKSKKSQKQNRLCDLNMAILCGKKPTQKNDASITGAGSHNQAWEKMLSSVSGYDGKNRNAVKRGGILHSTEAILKEIANGFAHCGARRLILNPFGESEVLVDNVFLFDEERKSTESKMGVKLMEWVDTLEKHAIKSPAIDTETAEHDCLQRLVFCVRWGLKCMLESYCFESESVYTRHDKLATWFQVQMPFKFLEKQNNDRKLRRRRLVDADKEKSKNQDGSPKVVKKVPQNVGENSIGNNTTELNHKLKQIWENAIN